MVYPKPTRFILKCLMNTIYVIFRYREETQPQYKIQFQNDNFHVVDKSVNKKLVSAHECLSLYNGWYYI